MVLNKGHALIMTAIAAAGLIVAAISVTSLSILVFAQQEQKPQQQKLVAQHSSSTDPIITNRFSSTANFETIRGE
jgi:flagellar basal body-associated protein FliL